MESVAPDLARTMPAQNPQRKISAVRALFSRKTSGIHSASGTAVKPAQASRPAPRDAGIFERLPAELWLAIATYLDIVDTASLAFSCSLMRQYFDYTWPIINSPAHKSARAQMLQYLKSSSPKYHVCWGCAAYNPVKEAEDGLVRAGLIDNIIEYPCGCQAGLMHLTSGPKPREKLQLDWSVVHLVMRAHRHDSLRHGLPLKTLHWPRDGKIRDLMWCWKDLITAKIVSGRLLLRIESRQKLADRWDLWPHYKDIINLVKGFNTCNHPSTTAFLEDMCKCALSHIAPAWTLPYQQCDFCAPPRRCFYCPSEFLVVLECDTSSTTPKRVLIVTRWIDVGEAVTPLSAEWSALIQQQQTPSLDGSIQETVSPFVMPGQATIRDRFHNNLDASSSHLYNDTATTYSPPPSHDHSNVGIESIRAMEQCSKSLSQPAVFARYTPRAMQLAILSRFFGRYAETEESMLRLRTTLTWKIPRAPYMQGTGETTRDENGAHWTSQRDRPYELFSVWEQRKGKFAGYFAGRKDGRLSRSEDEDESRCERVAVTDESSVAEQGPQTPLDGLLEKKLQTRVVSMMVSRSQCDERLNDDSTSRKVLCIASSRLYSKTTFGDVCNSNFPYLGLGTLGTHASLRMAV